jgi:hypothetical protein
VWQEDSEGRLAVMFDERKPDAVKIECGTEIFGR